MLCVSVCPSRSTVFLLTLLSPLICWRLWTAPIDSLTVQLDLVNRHFQQKIEKQEESEVNKYVASALSLWFTSGWLYLFTEGHSCDQKALSIEHSLCLSVCLSFFLSPSLHSPPPPPRTLSRSVTGPFTRSFLPSGRGEVMSPHCFKLQGTASSLCFS